MNDQLLTVDEAAELMLIEAATIQSWLQRGLPHTERPDGTIGIRRADLDAFLLQEGQGTARDAATET